MRPFAVGRRFATLEVQRRFVEASAELAAARDIVCERATAAVPAWCERRGWTEALRALSGEAVALAEREGLGAALGAGAPADLVALAARVKHVVDLPRAHGVPPVAPMRRASPRKRAQIAAMGALLGELGPAPARIVDVGSGHGHLTRHLARALGVAAEGWELDAARVVTARRLTGSEPARFVAADARTRPIGADEWIVGLHACGALGDHAVVAAVEAGAALALVACCLQKRDGDRVPLAAPADLAPALSLPRHALGLANVRDGGEGIEADLATRTTSRRHRLALRTALALSGQRVQPGEEMRGVNRRRATGSLDDLIAHAFSVRGMPSPSAALVREAARVAEAEHALARRWELPRAMLARLVEVWVALDRAAFLARAGHEVEATIAFDTSVSPRNVAVLARAP